MALIAVICLISSATSCTTIVRSGKLRPEYVGVDPRVQSLVDEYKWISAQNHIEFTKNVTIGLKKINSDLTIGLCNYGGYFREIDLDIDFWNNAGPMQRLALTFHELTHCYCNRGHDYGMDQVYPENIAERIKEALEWRKDGGIRPGHWDDGCPTSLMYPVVVDTDCMKTHYSEYIKEMLNRCEPW